MTSADRAAEMGQGKHNMQTFNQSLSDLVQRGVLSIDIAIARSSDPDELTNMIEAGKGLQQVKRRY